MNFSPSTPPGYAARELPGALPPPASAPPVPAPAAWAEEEWNPAAALRSLLAAWRFIGAFVAAALAVAWAVLAFWPREYTAETLVLLDPRNQPDLQLETVLAGLAPDDQTISSEVLILQSATLAAKVIGDLGLAGDPAFQSGAGRAGGLLALLPDGVRERLFASALPSADGAGMALAPEAALEAAEVPILQAFADRLTVERAGRSHAIRIAFSARSPGQAADVANRLAARYLESQLSLKFEAHGMAQDWLNARVAELQENVETAERAVEEYRAASGLLGSNGVTVTDQQMGEINTRLIAARAETAAARARLAQVREVAGRNGDALSAAEVLSSPLIHRLKEQEVEVLRRRADLAQEYGARHPRMLSVEAELSDIRGRIMAEVRQIVTGLENEVAVALAQEQALARDLARLQGETAGQNQAEVRLRALEREAQASRSLLETFLARIKEARNQEAIQRSDARILSPALPPAKPSSPREMLVMAAAAFLAFLAAASAVMLRPLWHRGAGDLATFRERTGLRVLAGIPKGAGRRGRAARSLGFQHAALLVGGAARSASAIMVTQAGPPAAAAGLSVALATMLARQGRGVLLVDGELEGWLGRQGGSLSAQLGLEGATGLAEVLAGDEIGPLPTAPSGIDSLRILAAGRGDPADTLAVAQAALEVKWERLRDGFAQIVVHGGPVLDSPAARLFAGQCDTVVLVARWDATPARLLVEAAAVVRENGGHVAGVVFLDTEPAAARGAAPLSPAPPRAAGQGPAFRGRRW